jgi:NAD(P)H-dependent FMN reductase
MATISVFVGSTRPNRQGIHVANHLVSQLQARGHTVHLIDPVTYTDLQRVDYKFSQNPKPTEQLRLVHDWLVASDGFLFVTPEYNHSFSGALKNAVDNFWKDEYARKPIGIVTYSGGPFGGVRALAGVRQIIPELGAVAAPLPLAISAVQATFAGGALADQSYVPRIAAFLDEFEWYVRALGAARATPAPSQ